MVSRLTYLQGISSRASGASFHGGSFLWGIGRPADSGFMGDTLAAHLGGSVQVYVLMVQHGLAADPASPFPAVIQDAFTAYAYLLASGVDAGRIVVSGDSAGAILALALLRYLAGEKDMFLAPGACLLFSPSVDLVVQGDTKAIDGHRNRRTDFLPGSMLAWGVEAFLPGEMERDDPWLAPARYPFALPTLIWV